MKLATAAQMREMDRRAIEEFGIAGIVLMENAASAVAREIAARYGDGGRRYAVVGGSGNNGGDGLAIARHLTSVFGWTGSIWLAAEPGAKSTADRATNLEIARRIGIPVADATAEDFAMSLGQADVIVDALLGTGVKGDPRAATAAAIRAINEARSRGSAVVAVDIPSGVDADTGSVGAPAAVADVTVTLGLSKIGLHLAPAYTHVGDLVVANLCIPAQLADGNPEILAMRTEPTDIARLLPNRTQRRDSNKSTYGSVALFAGSQGFAGAATLCCLGALRSGAGLVTLGVPEGLMDVMMARLPDEVMTRGLMDTGGRQFRHAGVAQAIELVSGRSAGAIGPGIGSVESEVRRFVAEFVGDCQKPLVIDADALNCLAQEADHGASIVHSRQAPSVLTPHPGEMGRLLGISSAEVQSDRLGSVRRAAEIFGCVVLLKGDRTLIAAPDGRLAINETGNAGMASGGMGDTLTGIAATFLAQIPDPFDAATAAAYVHGLAGDLAAVNGKAGMTATDLAACVPAAIAKCANSVN